MCLPETHFCFFSPTHWCCIFELPNKCESLSIHGDCNKQNTYYKKPFVIHQPRRLAEKVSSAALTGLEVLFVVREYLDKCMQLP